MKIDIKEIVRVSKLAKLTLKEDEKIQLSNQLSDIISYVEKINELNTDRVTPLDHIAKTNNVFRVDVPHKSIDIDDIKGIAPNFKDGHFIVPKVL